MSHSLVFVCNPLKATARWGCFSPAEGRRVQLILGGSHRRILESPAIFIFLIP